MGGIAGYIERYAQAEGFKVAQMCDAMRRGEDELGLWRSRNACLGMCGAGGFEGHRPMFSEDGMVAAVLDGEIHNHISLHSRLGSSGHGFRSRSDTEAIVHLYEDSGEKCVDAISGLFGLAVWDGGRRKLLIARDRLGIKPLYYFFDGQRFMFATEIKALLVEGCSPSLINMKALWDYLSLKFIPEPETIWEGIRKLPAGHRLVLDAEKWALRVEPYWDLPYEAQGQGRRPDAECLEEFSGLFEDSVALLSGANTGVFLSGGIDSTAVLSAASRLSGRPVDCFSFAFRDGGEFNELGYAREAVRHFGARGHEIVIGHKEFLDCLPEVLSHAEQPHAVPSSVPLYCLCKSASGQLGTVLTGDGADEMLGGSNVKDFVRRHRRAEVLDLLPQPVRRLMPHLLGEHARPSAAEYMEQKIFVHHRSFSELEKVRLLGEHGLRVAGSRDPMREHYERVSELLPLNRMLYVLSKGWLAADIYMKADWVANANSIALRQPFLDHRLAEWAARAPMRMKIGRVGARVMGKRVLRMYAKGRVPEMILNRKKTDTPVPVYGWLSDELRPFAHDMLAHGCCASDFFDYGAIASCLQRGTLPEASISDRHRLWIMLVLEVWFRQRQAQAKAASTPAPSRVLAAAHA